MSHFDKCFDSVPYLCMRSTTLDATLDLIKGTGGVEHTEGY